MFQQGITLLMINLESSTTVQVIVSTQSASSSDTWNLQQEFQNRRTKFSTTSYIIEREEYHLTPKNGNLHSQILLLNGKILKVDSSGAIPPLEPILKRVSDPITVAPFSVVFVVIPNVNVSAC